MEAKGIHQSDVILRTALVAALADLRAHPDLLDYVFASLPEDELTRKSYGEKSVQSAKDWFLKTNIPVVMVPRVDEGKVPCITIKLVSSEESETTLGDVHYEPTQDTSKDWPALAGPFQPVDYNPATGLMALPDLDIVVVTGQILVDNTGRSHEILDVSEDGVQILPGTVADFSKTWLKGQPPIFVTQLESVWYRENYQIGIHVSGEPVFLTWLHSIVVFALFRYKQSLMEARGFERSVFSSTDFDRNEGFEGEFVFSRYINIVGNVRQYWPKDTNYKLQSLQPIIRVADSGKLPSDTDPNDALWIGDQDVLNPQK